MHRARFSASAFGIAERAVQLILRDLETDGYVSEEQ
jgi:hypothetical protein